MFGLSMRPATRPATRAFQVGSGDRAVDDLAETAYLPALVGPHPEWQGAYDQDGPTAVETRRKLLERVVADKMMVCGAHFPFPGAGTFAKDGSGYVLRRRKTVAAHAAGAIDLR